MNPFDQYTPFLILTLSLIFMYKINVDIRKIVKKVEHKFDMKEANPLWRIIERRFSYAKVYPLYLVFAASIFFIICHYEFGGYLMILAPLYLFTIYNDVKALRIMRNEL